MQIPETTWLTIATQTRRVTVQGKSFARGGPSSYLRYNVVYPSLLLSGKWLQQYGFRPGQAVIITCNHGRLEISPAGEDTGLNK